eukprot:333059-Rhodomonas_salina.1
MGDVTPLHPASPCGDDDAMADRLRSDSVCSVGSIGSLLFSVHSADEQDVGMDDVPEPAGSERVGSERVGSERVGSERAGSEGTGSEGAGSERAGSERAESERAGSERAGSEARAAGAGGDAVGGGCDDGRVGGAGGAGGVGDGRGGGPAASSCFCRDGEWYVHKNSVSRGLFAPAEGDPIFTLQDNSMVYAFFEKVSDGNMSLPENTRKLI